MLSLTNADVVTALPILADFHEKADSGSLTTLTALTLTDLNDSEVVGATLCLLDTNTDVIVTGYTDVAGVLEFNTLDTAVDNTTIFGLVYKSFDSYIERAEVIISNDFRNRGLKLTNFLTTGQLKELHLLKTLELICLSRRKDASEEDIFHINFLDSREQYLSEINALNADYDVDESGSIEESEESLNTGQIRFSG